MPSLTDVARDMEQRAIQRGVCIVELSRGLRLQLVICGGYRVLSMSRPAVLPSNEEIGVCLDAFHVPTDHPDIKITMTNTEVQYRWPS